MSERTQRKARIVSSIAATVMSLACGSNYVYSAWGPQFAEKLRLSSTQQNLIGISANLGMYFVNIPIGMLIDAKGPRIVVIMGAVLLALGYFPLHQAYDKGFGSVPLLCMFSFFSGLGGSAAFSAALKTSALNWPHHRGTATAFPLAAFGLSAFFFSVLAQIVVPGSTGGFLMLLAGGTFGMVLVSFFFLRVIPHGHYAAVPTADGISPANSSRLHRTKSQDSKHRAQSAAEPGMSAFTLDSSDEGHDIPSHPDVEAPEVLATETDETSSLLSGTSSSNSNKYAVENNVKDHAHVVDIRGLKMLPLVEFWQLFALMGILCGIGLMTINNIGNDAMALWHHWDDSVTNDFVKKRQATHVSILSVCSFAGRLLSGVGSDFLVKILKASRLWCLTIASLLFLVGQVFALSLQNPNYLWLVSSLTGIAYGFLFGVFPSLVAEVFGVHGMSQNWGVMTLSPVISGNIFGLFYGTVYDRHSIVRDGGERVCTEGLECYRSAYLITVVASLLGLVVSLWSIRHAHVLRIHEERAKDLDERDD